MKGFVQIGVSIVFALYAGGAVAAPPSAGQHFSCVDGGTSSCASDDTGCVTDTKDHGKCSDGLAKAVSKAIASVIKCHIKQADAAYSTSIGKPKTFDEEGCEEGPLGGKSAKEKLDAAVTKVTALCSAAALSGESAVETTLFAGKTNPNSLDALNGGVYCQGTNDIDPSGDDAGKIPDGATAKNILKREDTVNKNLSKLIAATYKCHVKMASSFFKGKDFDEESCEGTNLSQKGARDKFNAARDKLIGLAICPPCLNGAAQDTLANTVQGAADTNLSSFYPCTGGPACTCAGGTPTKLNFTTVQGTGNCGHLDSDTATNFSQLKCGGLYFGGAGVGVPLPSIIPDMGASIIKVTSCAGTALTLANTTQAETGSIRNCTSQNCLFGPPLPIPNAAHMGSNTSTCVINTISSNAAGAADCNAGSTTGLNMPLTSALYLTQDLLKMRCNGGTTPGADCTGGGGCGTVAVGSCPGGGTCVNDTGRCVNNGNPCCSDGDCPSSTCETGFCVAGANANKGCIVDSDCPSSTCRTLQQPCPICNTVNNKCNGGPADGATCTPGDSALNGDYPTTHDCPPPPGNFLGNLPIGFNLDSGTKSVTAVNYSVQTNTFCGFCRNQTIATSFKNPAVPCTADANCTAVTGFTKCAQRTSGAFTADDVARTIVGQGTAAGVLTTGGAAKLSKIVSIFCIPPTFNSLVDSAADLPGPGFTALQGNTQLLP